MVVFSSCNFFDIWSALVFAPSVNQAPAVRRTDEILHGFHFKQAWPVTALALTENYVGRSDGNHIPNSK